MIVSRIDSASLAMGERNAAQLMRQMLLMKISDPKSEEEDSCAEQSDITTAFEREMDELASVVDELEGTLDVKDVEDLRELSESMYEGLATIRETHPRLRERPRNRGHQPSSSASSHATFGSRASSPSGTGRGKEKTRLKGGSANQKKLVTRCIDCNRFGHWSGDFFSDDEIDEVTVPLVCLGRCTQRHQLKLPNYRVFRLSRTLSGLGGPKKFIY